MRTIKASEFKARCLKLMEEVAASSLGEEFASLDDAGTEAEVEVRLAEMRSGG